LVEAHLHSTWLAVLGLSLGSTIVELLDLDDPVFPLLPEKRAEVENRARYERDALAACRAVIAAAPEVRGAWWYSEAWLGAAVQQAAAAFAAAFDRWRERFRAALKARDEARRVVDSFKAKAGERNAAKRRETEALNEIKLLLNQSEGERVDAEFYPYRYLA